MDKFQIQFQDSLYFTNQVFLLKDLVIREVFGVFLGNKIPALLEVFTILSIIGVTWRSLASVSEVLTSPGVEDDRSSVPGTLALKMEVGKIIAFEQ
ncbi:unnamed protein product [Rhizophagus irregularis]|nr:unnamed protein product [Rhizophagus irregularis]